MINEALIANPLCVLRSAFRIGVFFDALRPAISRGDQ
jgi:hypothetical protein